MNDATKTLETIAGVLVRAYDAHIEDCVEGLESFNELLERLKFGHVDLQEDLAPNIKRLKQIVT